MVFVIMVDRGSFREWRYEFIEALSEAKSIIAYVGVFREGSHLSASSGR